MPPTLIRVNDQFLNAGVASADFDERRQRVVFAFSPPETSLFNQLIDYLDDQPDPPLRAYCSADLGVGLAALCVRWGSSLATLMDADTLPHPSLVVNMRKAQDQRVSWLDDAEMARLNQEISANLAQLCRLYHDDCEVYMRLVMKAYHYLPMPITASQPDSRYDDDLWQAQFNDALRQSAQTTLCAGDEVIGDLLADVAWRSSSIERFHRGWRNPVALMPHERRFTRNEERKLLREVAGKMRLVDETIARLNERRDASFTLPIRASSQPYIDVGERVLIARS